MRILKVNMTRAEVVAEPFPKNKIIGGRAMIDFLFVLFDNEPPRLPAYG